MQADQLRRIYGTRRQHLAKLSSPHATRLAASIEEFCESLLDYDGLCSSVEIRADAPVRYLVFLAEGNSSVLGCLRIVARSDQSDEEWEDLWGSDSA